MLDFLCHWSSSSLNINHWWRVFVVIRDKMEEYAMLPKCCLDCRGKSKVFFRSMVVMEILGLLDIGIRSCILDSWTQNWLNCVFRMRGCSRSKFCINCWFLECWIWKSNSDTDWWIWNAFFFNYGFLNPECIFLLRIGKSGILSLNDGFFNVECIFWITNWWIQKFIGSVNPKIFQIL